MKVRDLTQGAEVKYPNEIRIAIADDPVRVLVVFIRGGERIPLGFWPENFLELVATLTSTVDAISQLKQEENDADTTVH